MKRLAEIMNRANSAPSMRYSGQCWLSAFRMSATGKQGRIQFEDVCDFTNWIAEWSTQVLLIFHADVSAAAKNPYTHLPNSWEESVEAAGWCKDPASRLDEPAGTND